MNPTLAALALRIAPPLAPVLSLVLVVAFPSRSHARIPEEKLAELPPAASRPVDFLKDVRPILDESCAKCHGRGKSKGGFRIDTRADLLAESDSGASVLPGNSRDSYLIHLVSGLDPDNIMPEKGTRLTSEQVGLLRAWIDQGVPWPEGTSFAREPHRNLHPRRPQLPEPGGDLTNPVDLLVGAYFKKHQIRFAPVVDDRSFARRAYLDVTGLLPTPEELESFLADGRSDRRARLVEQLLADNTRFAQHWLSFWNDLLRNDYRGTGYIDGGREQITPWLYDALVSNKPYDQFVRDLVNPGEKGPRGFTKGIVWRGVVNASQTPEMQAAQNIAQVFLGVNLKCASCHDSFIDDWQLADAYGMAGVYSDQKLEMVQCDRPLGKHASVKFLFPELGTMDDDAPRAERIARLADIMVSPANGRLPRTLVNRLWARLLGRGLVEPVDVMQQPAWDPDLLDWLAEDFVAHGYNLKRTLAVILTSRAYQLPTVDVPEGPAESYVFRGPSVRRMTAEQFRDALSQLTGVWHDKPEGGLDAALVEPGSESRLPTDAFWVWSDPHAAATAPPQTVHFRRIFALDALPAEAVAFLHVDNTHRLWVNGRETPRKKDLPWNEATVVDLRPFLKSGTNLIAIEASNGGEGPNPAGLLFYARLRPAGTNAAPLDIASDGAWQVSTNATEGWAQSVAPPPGAWSAAQVLGPAGMPPWNLGSTFAAMVSGRAAYGRTRTALVAADPLTTALGRPNREQVHSIRQDIATTLQMLELTNGGTLSSLLQRGAERLTAQSQDGRALVDTVFRRGLGRAPTPQEADLSLALVGSPPAGPGVEDLLWSVSMLPEFQIIR